MIIIIFLIVVMLTGVEWRLAAVWIGISLVTNDAEHLSMCLLITWLSSLETCLFRSLQANYSCTFLFLMDFRIGSHSYLKKTSCSYSYKLHSMQPWGDCGLTPPWVSFPVLTVDSWLVYLVLSTPSLWPQVSPTPDEASSCP